MKEFDATVINEENAKAAMKVTADVVKDVAAKSASGIVSGKGIVAGVLTVVGLAVVGGVMFWRKHKTEKEDELRKPDTEAPVELTDEDIEEITTAE